MTVQNSLDLNPIEGIVVPKTCDARGVVHPSAESEGELFCDLPRGHEGLHWDEVDDISWKAGRP